MENCCLLPPAGRALSPLDAEAGTLVPGAAERLPAGGGSSLETRPGSSPPPEEDRRAGHSSVCVKATSFGCRTCLLGGTAVVNQQNVRDTTPVVRDALVTPSADNRPRTRCVASAHTLWRSCPLVFRNMEQLCSAGGKIACHERDDVSLQGASIRNEACFRTIDGVRRQDGFDNSNTGSSRHPPESHSGVTGFESIQSPCFMHACPHHLAHRRSIHYPRTRLASLEATSTRTHLNEHQLRDALPDAIPVDRNNRCKSTASPESDGRVPRSSKGSVASTCTRKGHEHSRTS